MWLGFWVDVMVAGWGWALTMPRILHDTPTDGVTQRRLCQPLSQTHVLLLGDLVNLVPCERKLCAAADANLVRHLPFFAKDLLESVKI